MTVSSFWKNLHLTWHILEILFILIYSFKCKKYEKLPLLDIMVIKDEISIITDALKSFKNAKVEIQMFFIFIVNRFQI